MWYVCNRIVALIVGLSRWVDNLAKYECDTPDRSTHIMPTRDTHAISRNTTLHSTEISHSPKLTRIHLQPQTRNCFHGGTSRHFLLSSYVWVDVIASLIISLYWWSCAQALCGTRHSAVHTLWWHSVETLNEGNLINDLTTSLFSLPRPWRQSGCLASKQHSIDHGPKQIGHRKTMNSTLLLRDLPDKQKEGDVTVTWQRETALVRSYPAKADGYLSLALAHPGLAVKSIRSPQNIMKTVEIQQLIHERNDDWKNGTRKHAQCAWKRKNSLMSRCTIFSASRKRVSTRISTSSWESNMDCHRYTAAAIEEPIERWASGCEKRMETC